MFVAEQGIFNRCACFLRLKEVELVAIVTCLHRRLPVVAYEYQLQEAASKMSKLIFFGHWPNFYTAEKN